MGYGSLIWKYTKQFCCYGLFRKRNGFLSLEAVFSSDWIKRYRYPLVLGSKLPIFKQNNIRKIYMAESAITVNRQHNWILYLCKQLAWTDKAWDYIESTFTTHELNSWSLMEFLDISLTGVSTLESFFSILFTVPSTSGFTLLWF